MKSTFAVRHVHFEDLGVLEPFLREQGHEMRYFDAGIDDLAAVDAAAPQFHLEADPIKIDRWLVGHACELGQAGVDPRDIRRQALQFGPALSDFAPKGIGQWLAR